MESLHLAVDALGTILLPVILFVLAGYRSDIRDLRAEIAAAKDDIQENCTAIGQLQGRFRTS